MNLMIVESPNKIKKLSSILGDDWKVTASVGHIRDLPRKNLGIDAEHFTLDYEYIPGTTVNGRKYSGGAERLAKIKKETHNVNMIYIATDPDREGEAIAWHLKECLDLNESDYLRITFDSITDKAIKDSIVKARKIDYNLVYAQEARRALDRAYGYMVSPLLSNLLGMSLSAGRVQSPAVRLVVEREQKITNFKKTQHFGAEVYFEGSAWKAEWNTKPYLTENQNYILDADLAQRAANSQEFEVLHSENRKTRKSPPSPFSTSLLLQAASVKLKLDPEVTASLAQKLFEQGCITYIRTDSVNFSDEALTEIRLFANEKGLPTPEKARKFKSKGSAEEAHEAIRPTHIDIEEAGEDDNQRALYQLIWSRSLSSQLADAEYSVNTVKLESKGDISFEFIASGRVLTAPGWRSLTDEDAVIEGDEDSNKSGTVPVLKTGDNINAGSGKLLKKETKPAARFTKASLIAKLENEGVGRPSTYPAIMKNIMGKGYLSEAKRFLVPTETGTILISELIKAEFAFINLDFTRNLEQDLDDIANNKSSYLSIVSPAINQLKTEINAVKENGSIKPKFPCPKCEVGGMRRFKRRNVEGYLWACSTDECKNFMADVDGKPAAEETHNCPKCKTSPLRRYQKKDKKTGKSQGFSWFCVDVNCKTFLDDLKGKPVAVTTAICPACGKDMYRREGRYGYWWGCSGFKDGCKTTMNDENGKPVAKK